MKKYLYLNVNGFQGIEEKKKENLNSEECKKTAKIICERIYNLNSYDAIFFSEFDPNSDTGKYVKDYFERKGYNLILPNNCSEIAGNFYSVVVAFVRKELNISHSEPSPANWLTFCELKIDDYHIVGIHSTRDSFLDALKQKLGNNKEKNWIIIGDTNVSSLSERKRQEIIESIGTEILDKAHEFTFKNYTKIDRVFVRANDENRFNGMELNVIKGFYNVSLNEALSDHDALELKIPCN